MVVSIKDNNSKKLNTANFKKKLKEIAPVAISLILCMLLFQIITGSSCIFKATIGIPCPGCGLTRAGVSVLRLDFKAAFFHHPLFFLVPIVVILAIYRALNYGKNGKTEFKGIELFFKICLFAALGLYVLRMILFFPHTEPMTFNHNTILLKSIRFIRDVVLKIFGK